MTNEYLIKDVTSKLFTFFVQYTGQRYLNIMTPNDIENILADLFVAIESTMFPKNIKTKEEKLEFMTHTINSFHKNMVTKMYKEISK